MGPLKILMGKAFFRPYISQGSTDRKGWEKPLGYWHQFLRAQMNMGTYKRGSDDGDS